MEPKSYLFIDDLFIYVENKLYKKHDISNDWVEITKTKLQTLKLLEDYGIQKTLTIKKNEVIKYNGKYFFKENDEIFTVERYKLRGVNLLDFCKILTKDYEIINNTDTEFVENYRECFALYNYFDMQIYPDITFDDKLSISASAKYRFIGHPPVYTYKVYSEVQNFKKNRFRKYGDSRREWCWSRCFKRYRI